MGDLEDRISALIAATDRDPERLDCTLTDGYAQALALEAERRRLERRLTEMAQCLRPGDPAEKTIELSEVARRLDGCDGELDDLRGRLGELRRLRV
jgi:hypothetical protein